MISHLKLDPSLPKSVIAIGYGNTLRSDDGAGQKVVEIVDLWKLPQVRSLCVHQLTPELAAPIAEVELAIFVDVYPAIEQTEIEADRSLRVIQIYPFSDREKVPEINTHQADPQTLLQLANLAYGHAPIAWWILIPALNFEFGEEFSLLTQLGIDQALHQIKQIIGSFYLITINHTPIIGARSLAVPTSFSISKCVVAARHSAYQQYAQSRFWFA